MSPTRENRWSDIMGIAVMFAAEDVKKKIRMV